jgi:predicted RNase H-like HicB family nuclease
MMKDYHINIFYSEDDRGYIADIPDLKACSAFGETPDQALAEVLLAKEAWLAAAKSNGKPIPPPKYRPAIYQPRRLSLRGAKRRGNPVDLLAELTYSSYI